MGGIPLQPGERESTLLLPVGRREGGVERSEMVLLHREVKDKSPVGWVAREEGKWGRSTP